MEELLESLAEKAGCFISDLKLDQKRMRLIHVLEEIDPNTYTAAAWQEAFTYITEDTAAEKDCQAIRNELINRLKKQNSFT